jgi:hypothetical protein
LDLNPDNANTRNTFLAKGQPAPPESQLRICSCLQLVIIDLESNNLLCEPHFRLFESISNPMSRQIPQPSTPRYDFRPRYSCMCFTLSVLLEYRLGQRGPERRRRTNSHLRNCTFHPRIKKHGGQQIHSANQLHSICDYTAERLMIELRSAERSSIWRYTCIRRCSESSSVTKVQRKVPAWYLNLLVGSPYVAASTFPIMTEVRFARAFKGTPFGM